MQSKFRDYFYALFCENHNLRRQILKFWHVNYPINPKKHTRIADVFREFIETILYEPWSFKIRPTHFSLFGDHLAVQYLWLRDPRLRSFLVDVVENRHEFFTIVKEIDGCNFAYEGFCYNNDTLVFDPQWRRIIVRDFVWMILAKKDGRLVLELILALQELARVKRDTFLCNLHDGLQGVCNVYEVECV